jgi:hypothetical protein
LSNTIFELLNEESFNTGGSTMLQTFIGMIIGAMMAILAADGPATAERIMDKAYGTVSRPDLLSEPSTWFTVTLWLSVLLISVWWKRRSQPNTRIQTHYLL